MFSEEKEPNRGTNSMTRTACKGKNTMRGVFSIGKVQDMVEYYFVLQVF